MTPRLIGIGHKARQGKMRVAKAMHCALPDRSWIFHLADPLKAYVRVNRWMGKKNARLLQTFGTDIMREVDPLIWIKTVEFTIDEFVSDYGMGSGMDFIILPDVRFRNEAEWIKRNAGVMVKVERVMPDGTLYLDPDRPSDHPSEIDLDGYDGWDHVIRAQDRDLIGLASKAMSVLNQIVDSHSG